MALPHIVSLVGPVRAAAALAAPVFAFLWLIATRRMSAAKKALQAADRKHRLLNEALEATPCSFSVFSPDGTLMAWNSSYEQLHRHSFVSNRQPLTYNDLMRTVVSLTLPPEQVEAEVQDRVRRHFNEAEVEMERLYPDGRWMRFTKRRLSGGEVAGFALDITNIKARETHIAESESRYRGLVNSASVGIWHLRQNGETIFGNARLAALFDGTMPASLQASGLVLANDTRSDWPFGFQPNCEVETSAIRGDGSRLWFLVAASTWMTVGGGEVSCVLTLLDITPLKAAQFRVERLARYDSLTGLGNRALFVDTLTTVMQARQGCALLAIDLDYFKAANDRHGHLVGDVLLRTVGDRMRAAAPSDAVPCRTGGDEFAVLMPGRALQEAEQVAWRLAVSLAAPYRINDTWIKLSASIGVAYATPDMQQEPDYLVKAADFALYDVKRNGRAGVGLFSGEIAERFHRERLMRQDFEGALERDELFLAFQPQVDTRTQRPSGAEALLRWRRPRHEQPLSAAEFLPAAAELGHLPAIDAWVLDSALSQFATWKRNGIDLGVIAVNISTGTLLTPSFVQRLETLLRLHQVEARCLEIEIPESIPASDLPALADMLRALSRIGVRLALDDFGTGDSTFAHVVELSVNRIKLDRRVTAAICEDARMLKLVRAVLAFARGCDLEVIAEGVELQAQFEILRLEGCQTVQGNLVGRPSSPAAFERHLQSTAFPDPSEPDPTRQHGAGSFDPLQFIPGNDQVIH